MSLKNKFFSFIAVALSLAVFSTISMAQDGAAKAAPEKSGKHMKGEGKGWRGHGHGRHHGKRRGGMRMLHALNLTDAQKEQIRVIREANKPVASTTREEVQTLRAAKRAGTLTTEQQARLAQFKAERKANAESVKLQILAILTPEQKAQMEQKKAEMKQKREQRRQKRQQVQTTDLDG